ncbi:MAG: Hsp70 family protein [Pirellulales bacterium]
MPKINAVGIDLGTTYSAMAWVNEANHSTLIPNDQGDLLTPSVVLFEDKSIVVGKEAKKVAVLHPDRVASCVKRDMGKPAYSRPIRGKYIPPEVIQSYILKKLKDDIARTAGQDFRAIITVPAYFDENRRKATYQAGEMAGLKVLDIVNEPTAAALAYGEDLGYLTRFGAPKQRMNVIVYDLGGGTFDVTLIDMQAGDLRTLCTDGDVQLGGFDWDMRLVDFIAEYYVKQHQADPRQSPEGMQRMLLLAEEAKHTLSARGRTSVHLVHDGKSADIPITREQFEERTADLLERTRYTTRQLLATAGLEWKDISKILLTGGSTRMPMVVNMLRTLSGKEPDMSVNPDEAVARGAAVYANYLLASKGETGHAPTFDVTNVNAHSLGIEGIDPRTMRKRNKVLIKRNSPLPSKKVEEFITKEVNQGTVVVQVLEGESLDPSECTAVGRTVIRDLPPNLPQGWPVEVTYEYGINGRLNVKAKVRGTDREVKLELERDDSMNADRVSRWKRHVAAAAGLDAFDMAIQEELNSLKGNMPAGQAGAAATVSMVRPNVPPAMQPAQATPGSPWAGGAKPPGAAIPPGAVPPPTPPPGTAKPAMPPGAIPPASAARPAAPQNPAPTPPAARPASAAAAAAKIMSPQGPPGMGANAAGESQKFYTKPAFAYGMLALVTLAIIYFLVTLKYPNASIMAMFSKSPTAAVVVGIEQSALYPDPELSGTPTAVTAGTPFMLADLRANVARVTLPDGTGGGWVRRCHLCKPEEYERRKSLGQVPKTVFCIRAAGSGQIVYDGEPVLKTGHVVLAAGQALWLDPTMNGLPYETETDKVQGDPNVLLMSDADGAVFKLDSSLPLLETGSPGI